MKRFLALFICICMMSLLFAACKSEKETGETQKSEETQKASQEEETTEASILNETGLPIVNEKITLKAVILERPISGEFEDMYFFKEMEKLTNIHWEFKAVPEESWDEQKNLIVVSGDLPDVFMGAGVGADDHIKWGANDTLVDLNPYIDSYAPILAGIMEEKPIVRNIITSTDGKIYSFPVIDETPHNMPAHREWINVKWLENLGMEEPETLDDFYDVLVAFRDEDPDQNGKNDTIPLSGMVNNMSMLGTTCITTALGYGNHGLNLKDGEMVYFPAQPEFKEFLTYMNKLHKEELLDQEFFTHNNAQFIAKFKDYKVAVGQNAAPHGALPRDLSPNYRAITPMTSKYNSTRIWPHTTGIRPGGASITSKNEYPEATTRWFDFLYSEEGVMLYWYDPIVGERPKDAKYGYVWSDDRSSYDTTVPPEYENDSWSWRNKEISPASNGLPTKLPLEEYYKAIITPKNQYFLKSLWGLKEYAEYVVPALYFTEEEEKILNEKSRDLETYVVEMRTKFILGAEPMENFDEYAENLKKLGLDDYLSIYQTAYDRSSK
jgi:putative aldouronate transport system substrate-binding protein